MTGSGGSSESRVTNILLTGRPGAGKTTVITRLAELLGDRAVAGFYTGEIREGGQRRGFDATTFSGTSGVLAHVRIRGPHRVGRYGVDVAAFEQLVLPELRRRCDVLVIDEIGKMECFSARFVDTVRQVLDRPTPVVATAAISGGGLIAEVKDRPDAEVWKLTRENRDELPQELAARVAAISGW
jgi:nucleoside-triphosphatase